MICHITGNRGVVYGKILEMPACPLLPTLGMDAPSSPLPGTPGRAPDSLALPRDSQETTHVKSGLGRGQWIGLYSVPRSGPQAPAVPWAMAWGRRTPLCPPSGLGVSYK